MKKALTFLTLLIFTLSFVSCDFFSKSTTTQASSSQTTSEVITSEKTTDEITSTNDVTTTETITTTVNTTHEITTVPQTTTSDQTTTDVFKPVGYKLLQDELDYVGIPSIGSPKVLVFAVDFSDYPSSSNGLSIPEIDRTFNGASNEMDFESVNSYYLKSSYGKLDLQADVYGYYRASETSSYYENEYNKLWAVNPVTGDYLYDRSEVTYPESDLIFEILQYYDNQIDYSDYDYNNDGYIDGIYIVYSHPVSFYSGSDLWWAFQDYYAYMGDYFDGVEPLYICWSGSEFITEFDDALDARTLIHETGHMMGLDDYYDYDDSDTYNKGGLAGADMMDGAYGEHGPLSKLLLGWITPIVVESSQMIDISPYEDSGDVILVIDEWKNTIFDEYLLISLYTPQGLYGPDKEYYFNIPGITIYHVEAEIGDGYNSNSSYYTIFNYNNTDSQFKMVKYIEADMDNSVENHDLIENEDLFQVGDIFGDNIYGNYKWYNNTAIGFDIEITQVLLSGAILKITFE